MSTSVSRLEYFMGLDLGRRRDYSALVILERAYLARNTRFIDHTTRWEQRLTVRYAKQFRLGTPYGEVAQEVARIYRNLEQRGNTLLIFDQTGVGDAVEEMIRENLRGARQEGIVITQEIKRDIYAAIEIALEKGEVKISSQCSAAQQLREELLSVEIRRSGMHYKYGAFEKDAHDDLVMALGLACWRERMGRGRDNPYLRLPGY